PGHVGATIAQADALRGQRALLAMLIPAGIVGGIAGGLLLLHTGEKTFREVVPFLLLTSSVLLAAQDRVRALLVKRELRLGTNHGHAHLAPFVVGTAAVYGGTF